MMCHVVLIIENISTGASSNSWWSPEEGSYATPTPLGSFGVYVGRYGGLYYPVGDIVIVLEKA